MASTPVPVKTTTPAPMPVPWRSFQAEMDRLFGEEMSGVWQNTRPPRDALRALVPRIDAALAALPAVPR